MAGRNIVLYGMMGVGKSTVAAILAERLGREVVDTDVEVENAAGRRVAEIFDTEGEDAFRRLEREAVAAAAARPGRVVAVGGGAVLDEDNVEALTASGVLVELQAPIEVLARRLADADAEVEARPLLRGDDVGVALGDLLARRAEDYRRVRDVHVDAAAPSEQVADEILDWVARVPGVLTIEEKHRLYDGLGA